MKIGTKLPILQWASNYKKENLSGDFNAGITVGIMLIPQGMAYALLAGLPPIYGLYAAIVPQLVYAVLGTSRQLSVGPVAMDSLLVAVAIGQLAILNPEDYISAALLLALLVGIIQVLLGVFKLGFLVKLLTQPIISGFTSAAALIIGFSQLKYLLGVDLGNSPFLYDIFYNLWLHITTIKLQPLLIGTVGILLLFFFKKNYPKVPAPLLIIILSSLYVYFGNFSSNAIDIVGAIPAGLPNFEVPQWQNQLVLQLLPSALSIALVAFMEAIAVGKSIEAQQDEYTIDPNQELLAIGSGNILGALFQSFPTTGGFSRSAVNHQAGAKTNLAAIISAIFVLLVLLFFTTYFYYLPKTTLAAIIMFAVFKLIDIQYPITLWKKGEKQGFFILLLTFLATIFIGIQQGILIGVGVSLLLKMIRNIK